MKECSRCKQQKPFEEFHKSNQTKDGYQYRCKVCANHLALEWKKKNRDKYDSYNASKSIRMRLNLHGIPWEDWDELEPISKECAICGSTYRITIDHNHETGLVRGFLCDKHNRGLGFFGDSKEDLARAIEYLKNPPLAAKEYFSSSHDKATKNKAPRYSHSPELKKENRILNTCRVCGTEIHKNKNGLCLRHYNEQRELIEWPSFEELNKLVQRMGYSKVGRILGVSDNAVRKRLRNHPRK